MSDYHAVQNALSLPEKSDRVLALHDLYRHSEDPEAIFSALVNIATNREERHEC